MLSTYIYAYARRKLWRMWKHIESAGWGTIVYCDTDSLLVAPNIHIATQTFADIPTLISEHIGTDMGQLEVVMTQADAAIAMPKVYAMRDDKGYERIRVKGISKNAKVKLVPHTVHQKGLHVTPTQENLRNEYVSPDSKLDQVDFNTVMQLLSGKALHATYWYFERHKTTVLKRYATKVIKCN